MGFSFKPLKKEQLSRSTRLFLDPDQTHIALLDIESTGLFGDFDIPLCIVVKTYGKNERHVLVIDIENRDLLAAEEKLLHDLSLVLNDYDGVITYYGVGFDVPFLRTRMLAHGLEPLGKMLHLDVYFTARGKLLLSRNRLQNVIEMLRTADKSIPTKTRVDPELWVRATFARDKVAIAQIVEHCVEDVNCLEAVVNKLKDFLPDKIMRR